MRSDPDKVEVNAKVYNNKAASNGENIERCSLEIESCREDLWILQY